MSGILDEKVVSFLKNTCIFCQPWWLQAVSPDHWDVAVVERGEEIAAVLPYTYKIGLGKYLLIEMPPLTPYLGPWLNTLAAKYYSKWLNDEHELMTELIHKFPHFAAFNQGFHQSITNWLPFYWIGFQQTTRYTYIIEDLTDLDRVFYNFSHAKKKNIKRAKNLLEVHQDLSCEDFYRNHAYTLSKQGKRISYSYELFSRIYEDCYKHDAGKIFYAIDGNNNLHSAIFTVWDKNSAYDLISTIDPDFRSSGSASLLIQEAIKYYSNKTKKFDFEGSMIKGVERSFREFGARQVPYFEVSKINSKVVQAYRTLWRWTHR